MKLSWLLSLKDSIVPPVKKMRFRGQNVSNVVIRISEFAWTSTQEGRRLNRFATFLYFHTKCSAGLSKAF